MIVVTGATGNVGSTLLPLLTSAGESIRALSRQPRPEMPGVEWVQVEPGDVDALEAAFDGASKIALITAASEEMAAQERAVVEAAKVARVSHIVKLSGLGAGPDAPIRLPQQHYLTEQTIEASGIASTFVRPNLFMQVLLGSAESIQSDGAIYAPAADGAISFTDVGDIAAVMAAALTEPGHEGKTYEITGPEALSYADAAKILGAALDREVSFVDVPPEVAREAMLGAGLSPWVTEAYLELYDIYRAGYGSTVLAEAIEDVLGRPARTLGEFAEASQATFVG